MQTAALGRTSLIVSRATLGTMTFGSQVDEPTAEKMVHTCFEQGLNFIDTANVYNAGVAEEMLGRILRGKRDRVVLATKVGIKVGDDAASAGLSRNNIVRQIDASLRRLQTDHVDLFYLHQPDYAVNLEETLQTVDNLVQEGKVREVGVSNYAGWQVCRMLWLAEQMGLRPVSVVQPMYNLLARGIEQELVPMAREFELAVVPYNPLAGGLLTGKHHADRVPPGTRFERMPTYKDRYWNSQTFSAVERLTAIAREANQSLIELSFAWLLARPAVTSVIIGASSLEQLEQNLAAIQGSGLSPDVLAKCDLVWNDLRGVCPAYNR